MININGIKITNKLARDFFKLTESKPKEFIAWYKRNKGYRYPCLEELYKEWNLLQHHDSFIEEDGNIYLPFDVLELHYFLQENPKELRRFMKFLRELK